MDSQPGPSASKAPFLFGGLCFVAGVFLGRYIYREDQTRRLMPGKQHAWYSKSDAPGWLQELFDPKSGNKRLHYREWEDQQFRQKKGWHGQDLIHNQNSKAVCIKAYFWNEQEQTLTGIVEFGENAESHRGLAHGGAMTSAMDDVCGHACFMIGDGPWVGATVQVNCALKKPVKIGHTLKVTGKVESRTGRKVFIKGKLMNEHGEVYVEMDGISIAGVNLSQENDEIANRKWDRTGQGTIVG